MAASTPEERAKREAEILRLRRAGLSERQIAREVGTSRTTVWNTLQSVRGRQS